MSRDGAIRVYVLGWISARDEVMLGETIRERV
jgi:hypothetical protein